MIGDKKIYDASVAKWLAEERMTPEEIASLIWGEDGQPLTSHQIERKEFLEKHGDKPMTFRLVEQMLVSVGKEVGDQLRPMRRRIEALEAEVRVGIERIRALEGGQDES